MSLYTQIDGSPAMAENTPSINERRKSPRHEHRGHCTVTTPRKTQSGYIINLSETGALIALLDEHSLAIEENITLTIELDEGKPLTMYGKVAHIKEHLIGLQCEPSNDEDRVNLLKIIDELVP